MARFSQAFLQGLLQPTYQQGLFEAAKGLGQTPGIMRMERERKASQADLQRLLQENISNPAKLQQLANQYRAQGNEEAAEAFTSAATQATAKETTGRQRGVQGGLTAITQAAARGVPLQSDEKPDLSSAVSSVLAQGGTQAQIMEAYTAGVDMSKGKQRQTANVSPGGAIVDEQTGEVIYERPFKEEAEKTPSVKIQVVEGELFVFEGTDLVNRIKTEGDAEEEAGARNYVINSTMQTLSTVREAKKLLNETYFGVDPGGVSGSITSMISGSPSHELMTSSYVTIAGREALDEINRMKQEAAKYGSRGTGLGQVTQIEFSALQGNLAKLNTGLTVERQRELLNKIEEKLVATRRIASGENPIDVINFNDAAYIEAGYIKEGGEVYYFAPGGKEFIYDRNKEAFIPYGG